MSSSSEVPIVESAEAKGADRILLSPDGRWMVLEYRLPSVLPLLVRLDRRGQEPPVATRGIPAGPPGDDGTTFYVEQEAPDMRRIMATEARERRSHLRRLGSPERLVSRDGAYGARPVGEGRLVMFGGAGERSEVLVVDAVDGQVRASRELAGLGPMVASLPDGGRLYLLFDPSWSETHERLDGLILVALATDDLRELWRHEGLKPTPIFTQPFLLGTTAAGRRLLLMSEVSPRVVTFDAATGEPGPVLTLPSGINRLRKVHEAQPREEALVLWLNNGRGITRRGWQLLVVRDDRIDVVVDRPDALAPGAGVWDGHRVLIAAWSDPPPQNHPQFWEQPLKGYRELLDGQDR